MPDITRTVTDPYADMTDEALGQAVKKKYGDAYADLGDAELGAKMRVKATPQLGAVSKQARKNLANNMVAQTQNEFADDMRSALGQGIRSVAIPAVTGAVGLATGGLGAIPAAAFMAGAGGTVEYMAQTVDPSENVARDIVKEALFSGAAEFGGRAIGGAIGGALARRSAAAASRAAEGATKAAEEAVVPAAVRSFAERGSLPVTVPATKHGELWFNRALRTAVAKDADEIMRPFGGAVTPEAAGQEVIGVFDNLRKSTIDAGVAVRKKITEAIGYAPATTAAATEKVRDLASDLMRQADFPGRDTIVDQFKAVLRQGEIGTTLDQMMEFRTNVWSAMERMHGNATQKSYLKRLYGAVSEDIETSIAAYDPALVSSFRKANRNIASYYGALENEVVSRIVSQASEGNGTAVVRELFKADPSDINAVRQFVQNSRPQDAAKFYKTIQQAATQQILGIAEDGAPALGYKLADRLSKIGSDRLDNIFGWGKDGAETLARMKELAVVTSHYDNVLKYAPSVSTAGTSRIKKALAEGASAIAAGALGFKYIASRMGYNLARDAGNALMAEIVSNPQTFRQFKSGYQKVMGAATSGVQALLPQGEREMRAAIGAASARAVNAYRAANGEEAKRARELAKAPAAKPTPRPGAQYQ